MCTCVISVLRESIARVPVVVLNSLSKPSSVRRARAVTVTGIVTDTVPRLAVTLPLPMLPDAVKTPFSIVPTLPCTVQAKPLLSPSTGRCRYIAEAESSAFSPALSVMDFTALPFCCTATLSGCVTTSIFVCALAPFAFAVTVTVPEAGAVRILPSIVPLSARSVTVVFVMGM